MNFRKTNYFWAHVLPFEVLEMTLGNDIETACKAAENLALKAYGVRDELCFQLHTQLTVQM